MNLMLNFWNVLKVSNVFNKQIFGYNLWIEMRILKEFKIYKIFKKKEQTKDFFNELSSQMSESKK